MNAKESSKVTEYAAAVRSALADLPAEQARDVLDGLDEHLAEVAAEGTVDLAAVLGPPGAYAQELRASAGLGIPATAPTWTPPTTAPVELHPPAPPAETSSGWRPQRGWHRLVARLVLGGALGLLAVIVIRADHPINGIQIVLGAAFAAALAMALRWIAARAELPDAMAGRLALVLAAAALLFAVLLGSKWSGGGDRIYVDVPAAFDTPPAVPDVVGMPVDVAVEILQGTGFAVSIVDDAGPGAVVTEVIAPGNGFVYLRATAEPVGSTTVVDTTVAVNPTVAVSTTLAPVTTLAPITTLAPVTTLGPVTTEG
jgi:hypothetical protein